MEYTFKNKVSEEDFIAFYTHHLKKTMLRPFSVGLYGLFVVFLIVGPILTKDYSMYMYLGFFAIIVLFIVTSISRKGKKLYAQNSEAFQMTYTLKDDSLLFVTSQGQNEKLWSEFHTIYETEAYLFIYLKNKRGLMFVKSNMTEDMIQFLISKCKSVMSPKNLHLQQK